MVDSADVLPLQVAKLRKVGMKFVGDRELLLMVQRVSRFIESLARHIIHYDFCDFAVFPANIMDFRYWYRCICRNETECLRFMKTKIWAGLHDEVLTNPETLRANNEWSVSSSQAFVVAILRVDYCVVARVPAQWAGMSNVKGKEGRGKGGAFSEDVSRPDDEV